MTLQVRIKSKFPALVVGGNGVAVEKSGGVYTLSFDEDVLTDVANEAAAAANAAIGTSEAEAAASATAAASSATAASNSASNADSSATAAASSESNASDSADAAAASAADAAEDAAEILALVEDAGTWTPQVTFGGASVGITYSVQTGKYTKRGDIVLVECKIILSAKGSSTGSAAISGLPFSAPGNSFPTTCFANNTTWSGFDAPPHLMFVLDGATVALQYMNASGDASNMTDAHFEDATGIRFTAFYSIP